MTDIRVKTTAVLVTFHTGPDLFRAIASLCDQEGIFEIVVVNNGNPDHVESALTRLSQLNERVVLVSGHGNIGFAAGCNLGAQRARGEFLLLINPDAVLSAGGVARMLEDAAELNRPWMLGCRLVNSDGTEQRGGRRELLTPANAVVEGLGLYRLLPGVFKDRRLNLHQRPLPGKTTEVPAISGACMMLPLEDYRSIGGMDEKYFLHVEDLDFCLRFRRSGGRIYFCPDVLLTHEQGSSDVSAVFVEWQKVRSFRYYFRKHFTARRFDGSIALVYFCILLRFVVIAALGILRPGRKSPFHD